MTKKAYKIKLRKKVKQPGRLPKRWFGSSVRRCCRCNCFLRRTYQQISQTLQKKSPLFNRDAGAVIAGKLGLIARGEDQPSRRLPISADILGDDPFLWSDRKSGFVCQHKDLSVVVERKYFPTVGTFVQQDLCLFETIEYNSVSNVFAVFLHVNYILDVHDVLQMTTGSEE